MRENPQYLARANQRQVALLGRAEVIVRDAGKVFDDLTGELTQMAVSGNPSSKAIDAAISKAWAKTSDKLWSQFESIGEWAYTSGVNALTQSLPRSSIVLMKAIRAKRKQRHHESLLEAWTDEAREKALESRKVHAKAETPKPKASIPSIEKWRQAGGAGVTASGRDYKAKYSVAQHESVWKIRLNEQQAHAIVSALSERYGVKKPEKVTVADLTKEGLGGGLTMDGKQLRLSSKAMNQVQTLAHEMAHGALGYGADVQASREGSFLGGHGKHHVNLTAEMYDWLVDHGLAAEGIPRYSGPMQYGDKEQKAGNGISRRKKESLLQEADVADLFPTDEEREELRELLERVETLTREEYMRLVDSFLLPAASEKQLKKWIVEPAPDGLDWETRLKSWDKKSRDSIRKAVLRGFSEGESVPQVRKRIENAVAMPRYAAQRIARTEGCRIGNAAGQEALDSLGDFVTAYRYRCQMTRHSREPHKALNGVIYKRTPRGEYRNDNGEVLPTFPNGPNCQCMGVPLFLGIEDVDITDPERDANMEESVDSSAFSGINGQIEYGDPGLMKAWWDKVSVGARKTLVGVKKYRSLKRRLKREPTWDDVVGAS